MEENQNIWKRKFLKIFTLFSIIGLVLGAIGGYLYYSQIGCESGNCGITSNPYASIAWGAAMGFLLGDMLNKKDKKG